MKIDLRTLIIYSSCALSISTSLYAQEKSLEIPKVPEAVSIKGNTLDDLMNMSIEDISELPVRTESFLNIDKKNISTAITTIDKDQISNSGARNLSEILELYVPGFQYMINKWNGIVWGMRGVANDRNTKFMFLVNGHQMNMESRDGAMLEQELGLLGDIERIEVLRGPAGLLYGSGAIAGVVNIITKQFNTDAIEVKATGLTYGSNNAGLVEFNATKKINNDFKISLTGGIKVSEGTNFGSNRIYGAGSWPFPNWAASNSIPQNGAPTTTGASNTPGNHRLGLDLKYKNINFYSRYTNQVTNASGYFILDPWGGKNPQNDSTIAPQYIDGKLVDRLDPFYGNVQPYNTNRRQYIAKNWSNQITYIKKIGVNELKFDAGFDMVTNRITMMKVGEFGYTNSYGANNDKITIAETFGEKRYSLRGIYVINSNDKLKLAFGYQFRLFDIGKDMDGWNMVNENKNHYVVKDVLYTNNALFTEGLYEISKKTNVVFGARYDVHTRTISQGGVFTPKLGIVTQINDKHSLKLVFQSSANNGSTDNYEYGRNSVDNNGNPLNKPRFEDPNKHPQATFPALSPVSDADLHALRPEKSRSLELLSTHKITNALSINSASSYNSIKDLFVWNEALFRVINGGQYNFINIDLEANYVTKLVRVGINHTFQRMIDTDNKQVTEYQIPNYTYVAGASYDSVLVNGAYVYTPITNGTKTDGLQTIKNVSTDGKNFNNLSTNLTKLSLEIKPTKWLTLNSNLRVFWSLKGRADVESKSQFNHLGISTNTISKLSLAAHFQVGKSLKVSVIGYDLLGSKGSINAVRWQQMGTPDQTDLFTVDLRSFAVSLTYNFQK